jgi:hypothetical protein
LVLGRIPRYLKQERILSKRDECLDFEDGFVGFLVEEDDFGGGFDGGGYFVDWEVVRRVVVVVGFFWGW